MQLLPAGAMLGGYEIDERVGKGGMGEVFRARQVSMDRVVALKVLSPVLAQRDPAFAERFVAEARAAGRLNHPNLVAVHDVASAPAPAGVEIPGLPPGGTLHYFSMELIEGETVKDILEREGFLANPLIGRIMAGMAEALIYAHGQHLIHRDIKPDNIMVAGNGLIKLADLGLATDAESSSTGDGKVMGTPLYMSPEQARAQPLDGRSDFYSLGATLYHCLTGRAPYSGDNARAIMRAHVSQAIPDPADLRPDVSPSWRSLCMLLMSKLPEERPGDAKRLRDLVRQAISGGTFSRSSVSNAVLPSVAEPSVRTRPRWLMPALIGGGVVIVVGIAVALVGRGKPSEGDTDPAHHAESHPENGRPAPVTSGHPENNLTANAPSLDEVLKTLPSDPEAQLAAVEKLLTQNWPAASRDRLQAMINPLSMAIAAARRSKNEAAIATAIEPINRALEAGELGQATTLLAALSSDAQAAAAPLKIRLTNALAARKSELQTAIAALNESALQPASRGAPATAIAKNIAASGCNAEDQQALEQALSAKIESLRRAQERIASALQGAGAAIEELRSTVRYDELSKRLSAIPLTELDVNAQRYLAAYREYAGLAAEADAAFGRYVKAKEPMVTYRMADGSSAAIRLIGWSGGRLVGRHSTSSSSLTLTLGDVDTVWAAHLTAALAGDSRAEAKKLAFLWHWRQPEALTLSASGEFAEALSQHDLNRRAVSGLVAPLTPDGDRVTLMYAFASEQRSLVDWDAGTLAASGPRGLNWVSTGTLPQGDLKEKDLPSVRWRGQLHLPVELRATIICDPESSMGIGLSDGHQTVRLMLLNRLKSPSPTSVVWSDENQLRIAYGSLNRSGLWTAPVQVRITISAQGQIAFMVNGAAVTPISARSGFSFPSTAAIGAVITATTPTTASVTTLSISGLP